MPMRRLGAMQIAQILVKSTTLLCMLQYIPYKYHHSFSLCITYQPYRAIDKGYKEKTKYLAWAFLAFSEFKCTRKEYLAPPIFKMITKRSA